MTNPAPTDAVFFDLDGTLIDTAPDMGGALNRVLHAHGRAAVSESIYRPQVSHGSIALLKLGFPELDPASQLADLRSELLDVYERYVFKDSTLFPGIEQVLTALENRQLPWGIITNKPEYLTLKLLDAMKLTDRCASIVAADTAAHAKPHPAPMLLACERAGVDPQRCLYIGDAQRDIAAGRSVKMKTLIASWGYIDPENDDPQQWNADAELQAPAEILNHIVTALA